MIQGEFSRLILALLIYHVWLNGLGLFRVSSDAEQPKAENLVLLINCSHKISGNGYRRANNS